MLPALSFAILRGWDEDGRVANAVRARLSGAILRVPSVLPITEREELVEALATFCRWPIQLVREDDAPVEPGYVFLATASHERASATPGSLWVLPCEPSRAPRSLDLDAVWIALRDAVCACFGARYANTRLRSALLWASDVTDSPSTALRFLDGVLRAWLAQRDATDAALFSAGLSSVIAWLLRGVDPLVAQWVVALALGRDPALLVGNAAALLGREPAIHRAFDAGLIDLFDPSERPEPDLRRPLDALSRADRWPLDTTLDRVANQLGSLVLDDVTRVFWRSLRAVAVAPLGLVGPKAPGPFVTHPAAVDQACAIFEAEATVRTVVLRGIAGSGKTSVAAHICARLAPDREPIWVSFADGPREGWARVGAAMKLRGLRDYEKMIDDVRATPRWVELVFDELRARRAVIVIEDADVVDEADLRHWIPGGAGRCHVLILSERAQRWLQSAREAIVVDVGPLDRAAARDLLVARAPSRAQEIQRGEADGVIERLGGHMGALALLGARIARTDAPIDKLVEDKGDPIPSVVRDALESLDETELDVVDALAVCANGAAPRELLEAILDRPVQERVIDELEQRSMLTVRGATIELSAIIRAADERRLSRMPSRSERLAKRHATAVTERFDQCEDEPSREALVPQLSKALRAATNKLETDVDLRALDAIWQRLARTPHVNQQTTVQWVIEAFETMLERSDPHRTPQKDRFVIVNRLAEALLLVEGAGSDAARSRAIELLRLGLSQAQALDDEAEARVMEHALCVALSNSKKAEHRQEAAEVLRRVLARTSKSDDPHFWASAATNLAATLASFEAPPHAEITELLRGALTAAEAARDNTLLLTIRSNLASELASVRAPHDEQTEGLSMLDELVAGTSKFETPNEWARVRLILARALLQLRQESRESVERAIELLQSTLEVWTEQRSMARWTRVQFWLAAAFVARAALARSITPEGAEALQRCANNAARGYAALGDQDGVRKSIALAEQVRRVIAEAATAER